jgi:hypothetical protein
MKTILKSAALILLGIIFSGRILAGQEPTQSDKSKVGSHMTKSDLTDEQKAMLKNNLQKRKEIRDAFKGTLTQEQKDMLTDPRLVRADRIKNFRASLTDQQVNMIKARKEEIKANRAVFRATLTDQQKMQFKKLAANRSRLNRAIFIRARLRHRLLGI